MKMILEISGERGVKGATIDVQKKRRYQQPALKCYGSVKMLTASGTGGDTENATGNPMNPCTEDKNKRFCL